ncbi:MAG: hypothetical protein GC187_03905 [Alphaproteobacteria bacterium]|nr:hypothetical protein [Alphaproteobacteria bacterium]
MGWIERWTQEDRGRFRAGIVRARHRLADSGLFCDPALEELVETHPRELLDIAMMDEEGSARSWTDLSPGERKGAELLAGAREGRVWMNLRQVFNIRPEYRALLGAVFAELRELHPRFRPEVIKGGLLISSPGARVPFHIDRTDTMLWHLRGRKRVFVYPRSAPVLHEADIEAVLMHPFSDDLPYKPAFDARAQVFDLEPGDVLCWPVHTPHRVVNLDGLNVSMTTEYACRDVRVRNQAMIFNGLIRRRLGLSPSIEGSRGLGLAARAGLGFAARKMKLVPKVSKPALAVDAAPGAQGAAAH